MWRLSPRSSRKTDVNRSDQALALTRRRARRAAAVQRLPAESRKQNSAASTGAVLQIANCATLRECRPRGRSGTSRRFRSSVEALAGQDRRDRVKRSRGLAEAMHQSDHAGRSRRAIVRRRKRSRRRSGADTRRPGDYERLGNAGCASSLESESIPRKRSRISEGPPPGACWPALDQLTHGRAGFCNRRGAAVWPADTP